jgi:uncharacterized protein (DUF952 family)
MTAAPSTILHVATLAGWERWAGEDDYLPRDFPAEGFIHCCSAGQLPGVLQRYYAGRGDLLLLHIDPAKLLAPLRYEGASNGDTFPHIYGPLNKDAVESVEPLPGGPAA